MNTEATNLAHGNYIKMKFIEKINHRQICDENEIAEKIKRTCDITAIMHMQCIGEGRRGEMGVSTLQSLSKT